MRRIMLGAAAALALAAVPGAARAQGRWKAIGTTSSGNTVYVDPKTVHETKGLVSATVRVVFTTPVQTPQGPWKTVRTSATFDCAHKTLAAKESVYYADAKETKVAQRKVNKIPGFGPALGGSLGGVALGYLCAN